MLSNCITLAAFSADDQRHGDPDYQSEAVQKLKGVDA